MPKQKVSRTNLTSGMRNWTDLEVRSLFYLLEQPHLIQTKHKIALQRIGFKARAENRSRSNAE